MLCCGASWRRARLSSPVLRALGPPPTTTPVPWAAGVLPALPRILLGPHPSLPNLQSLRAVGKSHPCWAPARPTKLPPIPGPQPRSPGSHCTSSLSTSGPAAPGSSHPDRPQTSRNWSCLSLPWVEEHSSARLEGPRLSQFSGHMGGLPL